MPWATATAIPQPLPPCVGEHTCDVLVIGAGLTGLCVARRLARGGAKVIVLEAAHVGAGTTGCTSAHLTMLPDIGLPALRRKHGDEVARRTLEAGGRGIRELESWSAEEGAVAVHPADVWQYAETADQRDTLDAQIQALEGLQIPYTLGQAPLPFPTEYGLRLREQGMLHPVRMLRALVQGCLRDGVALHTGSRVRDCQDGEPCEVRTDTAVVRATHVVQATHTPIGLLASLQTRLKPMTSHVLRVRLARPLEPGLFYDLDDPYHFLRPLGPSTPDQWLVGGADVPTGTRDSVVACWAALERYARDRLPVIAVEDRWSHELFEPADGLPYIGLPLGSSHVHVITGLSGTGLTWGPAAAQALADHLLGRDGPGEALLQDWAASRLAPVAGAGRMISANLEVLYRFFADRLRPEGDLHPRDLDPGHGRLIQDGVRTIAVWRDPDGGLHVMSPVCSHLGCIVQWNDAARTWDCPCHGGRYAADGSVMYGPPTTDLDRRKL